MLLQRKQSQEREQGCAETPQNNIEWQADAGELREFIATGRISHEVGLIANRCVES